MKRIIALLLAVLMLCMSAFAEVDFSATLSGVESNFALNRTISSDGTWTYWNIQMVAIKDGQMIDKEKLLTCNGGEENFRVRVMRLDADRLFVETRFCVDSVATNYEVLAFDGEYFTVELNIYDPGCTDGYELRDGKTDELIVSSETYDAEELQRKLNALFADYGVTFKTDTYAIGSGNYECLTVDLPAGTLIVDATAVDIISGEETTVETVQIATEAETVETAESTDTVAVAAETVVTDKATVSDTCNLREGPGTEYEIVGKFEKGKEAVYLNQWDLDTNSKIWYKVDYDGLTAWVSGSYCTIGDDSNADNDFDETEEAEEKSESSSSKSSSSSSSSKKSSSSSSSKKSSSSSSSKSSSSYKVVATGDCYIRDEPNRQGSKITVLKEGKSAKIVGKDKYDERGVAWHKVSYNGKTGYVSSKYTKVKEY